MDDYTKKLETIIKQMLIPLKNIPFNLVIENICGYKVIPFNHKNKQDIQILETLIIVANTAGGEINEKGIIRTRPNEVGNDIELFVQNALNSADYKARRPKTTNGPTKSMGYPDISFMDEFGQLNYLECKTFNLENLQSSQRSFYLSPAQNFKVTANAHHFVISFEIYEKSKKGNMNLYGCKSWKILSIEQLDVDVKYEFNCGNDRLYKNELLLAEGRIV